MRTLHAPTVADVRLDNLSDLSASLCRHNALNVAVVVTDVLTELDDVPLSMSAPN